MPATKFPLLFASVEDLNDFAGEMTIESSVFLSNVINGTPPFFTSHSM